MQAIVTKYLPATNTRGSRIKAYTHDVSITVRWDHELSNDVDNYRQAAMALVAKYGWPADNWISGGAPDGYGYVFVRAS